MGGVEEKIRGFGIEFEKIEMAGDGESGVEVIGEVSCLSAVEVSGDASFRAAAIDGKQGDIDMKRSQEICLAVVEKGIAGVVDTPLA